VFLAERFGVRGGGGEVLGFALVAAVKAAARLRPADQTIGGAKKA
jgi:hypothetical protein